MGRHSASYIAAQQGLPAESTGFGAARFVGRVGALALALGVGAAVVGGAGLANAEGASDGGSSAGAPSDAGTAKASSDPAPAAPAAPAASAADATAPVADASPTDSTGVRTRKPSSLDPPKMVFDGGVPRHRPSSATHDAPTAAPVDDPPTDSPATTDTTPSSTAAHDATPVESRRSDRPSGDSRQAPSTNGDGGTVASLTRTKTDDAAATERAATAPAKVEPSPAAAVTTRQLLTPSPSADPAPVTSLAAAVPAAVPVQAAPVGAHPIVTLVSDVLNAIGVTLTTITTGWPLGPIHLVVAALQLIHREIDDFVTNLHAAADYYSSAQVHVPPATATTTPAPGDETQTAYGDIGKWMLESNGQISDYGGQPYGGKTLLEAVNVIIVDPNSTTPEAAATRLNAAMFWAGFPAQPIHSTGFEGEIDDVVYGQQPTGLLEGFSDNLFILPNDHGRIFGPDPVETSSGYVWSGAFSTEALTIYNFLPAHAYVSSDMARTALATRLILSGQATYVGMVPLDNAVDTATTTTGDHDGYAVVLKLT